MAKGRKCITSFSGKPSKCTLFRAKFSIYGMHSAISLINLQYSVTSARYEISYPLQRLGESSPVRVMRNVRRGVSALAGTILVRVGSRRGARKLRKLLFGSRSGPHNERARRGQLR